MAKKNDVNLISVTHKRDEFHRNGWLKLSFAFSYSLKSQTHKIMSEHRNCKDIEGGKNIYGKTFMVRKCMMKIIFMHHRESLTSIVMHT